MKICIVTADEIFPPTSGAPKRVCRIAEQLASEGAEVIVLHHGKTATSTIGNLQFSNFRPFRASLDSRVYFHPFNPFFPSTFRGFLNAFKPDIVQCESPWSVLPTLFFTKSRNIPCVLDEHNVEVLWSLYSSKVPLLAPYTCIIEKFALNNSNLILATSETDKFLISKIFRINSRKISVVPNGVDVERFSVTLDNVSEIRDRLGINTNKKIVLFHGLMSAKQNYEAASIIIDYISPKIENAVFIIIGKNPPEWLKNTASGKANVIVLDYVSNIEDYIVSSDLCIVPICSGSGTRLKILEYMAAGKPIVSTVVGAEGIPLESGVNAILLDKVDSSFVDSVRYLLSNEVAAKELGSAAKCLSMRFSWKCIGKSLYDFYIDAFENNLQKSELCQHLK